MNLRLFLLNIFTPNSLKDETMRKLFVVTANAFQIDPPLLDGLSFNDILQAYATFTRAAAAQQISKLEDVSEVEKRLFDGAFQIGDRIRHELKIGSRKDALRGVRLLYREMGIDFCCGDSGDVTVKRCYFSDFYTCEVCWIISSLDEGLVAGLTDGGRLWFLSRITEGNKSCIGTIEFETSL